jgi:Kef-type K+ transport system membrane component KefB
LQDSPTSLCGSLLLLLLLLRPLPAAELLLPLFFASSGIKTDIGALNTWRYWGIVLALICIASASKFTPTFLVSKLLLRDKGWRFCAAIGLLMNTRGLVELIALNIGLSMVRSL